MPDSVFGTVFSIGDAEVKCQHSRSCCGSLLPSIPGNINVIECGLYVDQNDWKGIQRAQRRNWRNKLKLAAWNDKCIEIKRWADSKHTHTLETKWMKNRYWCLKYKCLYLFRPAHLQFYPFHGSILGNINIWGQWSSYNRTWFIGP
jgi:hypothetical protein